MLIAGGISRLGPINPKGDALSEKIGSVRIVSPSFLIKKVESSYIRGVRYTVLYTYTTM